VTLDSAPEVLAMTIYSNGIIATGCVDSTVQLWNSAEPNLIMPSLRGHSSGVRAVAFSPNDTQLVSSSDDRTIRI